jgi:Flp pilus assembly protein TadD
MTGGRWSRWGALAAASAVYAVVLWPGAPSAPEPRADPLSPQVRAIELAIRDDKAAEALRLMQTAVRLHPHDPFLAYLEALVHRDGRRWAEEAAAWERYIAMADPPDAGCPAVALAHERAGAVNRALEWYRKCAAFEPVDPERLEALADALDTLGHTAEADATRTRAASIGPHARAASHAVARTGDPDP